MTKEEKLRKAEDDRVGAMVYMGNTVEYIYRKHRIDKDYILDLWNLMREFGYPPDGSNDLLAQIRRMHDDLMKKRGGVRTLRRQVKLFHEERFVLSLDDLRKHTDTDSAKEFMRALIDEDLMDLAVEPDPSLPGETRTYTLKVVVPVSKAD